MSSLASYPMRLILFSRLPKQSMVYHTQILAREYLLTLLEVDWRGGPATGKMMLHQTLRGTALLTDGSLRLKPVGLWVSTSTGGRSDLTVPFLQQIPCATRCLGYVSAFGADLQCVFSDYITSEKASGPSSIHQRQG